MSIGTLSLWLRCFCGSCSVGVVVAVSVVLTVSVVSVPHVVPVVRV